MLAPIVVLGAELQPSVSMALSRPDLQFRFISERDVIDGWDLRNVEIKTCTMERFAVRGDTARHVVLSPVWLSCLGGNPNRFALSSIMIKLSKTFSDWVLPVSDVPFSEGWVLKGDLFHRPDAILSGEGALRAEVGSLRLRKYLSAPIQNRPRQSCRWDTERTQIIARWALFASIRKHLREKIS